MSRNGQTQKRYSVEFKICNVCFLLQPKSCTKHKKGEGRKFFPFFDWSAAAQADTGAHSVFGVVCGKENP